MDHQHSHRTDQSSVPCHCHHRCGRSSDAVNFHGDLSGVIPQHGVNLCRCEHVAAGRVDPNGHISGVLFQLCLKSRRCNIVLEPRILCNRTIKVQIMFRSRLVFHPFPKPVQLLSPPFANAPASCIFVKLPFTRYKSPPSSAGIRLSSSRSRMSLADIQPFCRAVAYPCIRLL